MNNSPSESEILIDPRGKSLVTVAPARVFKEQEELSEIYREKTQKKFDVITIINSLHYMQHQM